MFENYQYAYLIGVLIILLPIWLLFFFLRKDVRREMLLVSLFFGVAGPVSELWYLKDYWHPTTFAGWPIGIEDFLFGFFAGGIAAVMYEVLFNKHFAERKKKISPYKKPMAYSTSAAVGLYFLTNINSIYISILFFVLCALVILFYRKDLLSDVLISGCLGGSIALAAYIVFLTAFPGAIHQWWQLSHLSGIFIWHIPIEELFWAFGFGMLAGPVYEFLTGKVFKRQSVAHARDL